MSVRLDSNAGQYEYSIIVKDRQTDKYADQIMQDAVVKQIRSQVANAEYFLDEDGGSRQPGRWLNWGTDLVKHMAGIKTQAVYLSIIDTQTRTKQVWRLSIDGTRDATVPLPMIMGSVTDSRTVVGSYRDLQKIPNPAIGQIAWTVDSNMEHRYNGAAWEAVRSAFAEGDSTKDVLKQRFEQDLVAEKQVAYYTLSVLDHMSEATLFSKIREVVAWLNANSPSVVPLNSSGEYRVNKPLKWKNVETLLRTASEEFPEYLLQLQIVPGPDSDGVMPEVHYFYQGRRQICKAVYRNRIFDGFEVEDYDQTKLL